MNKLSIFASVGAISIIGVGVLTFSRPVAIAYVAPKATVVAEVIPETPVQPTPVVPVEVVTPVEPVGTTVQVVITAPVAPVTPVTPVILSTQAYADKYLDLSVPQNQKCLDRIIQVWPDRFLPEVRERNIKALRAWAGVCSTGAYSPAVNQNFTAGRISLHGSLIGAYGINGEFFDTSMAKAYADR